MGLLESLRKSLSELVKIDVNNLRLFRDFNIHINFGGNHSVEQKTLNIDVEKLSNEEKKELQGLLKQKLDAGTPILESGFKAEGDKYNTYNNKSEFSSSLAFYKKIISKEDYKILKASYYLRSKLETNDETADLKESIVSRFGDRGRNISNLCSAGYFETYIRPLYDEVSSREGFSADSFIRIYNDIIETYPFALFVSPRDGETKVKEQILRKMVGLQKYGIKQLNIHGIGKSCVKSIRHAVEEIDDDGTYQFTKTITEQGKIIIVELTSIIEN